MEYDINKMYSIKITGKMAYRVSLIMTELANKSWESFERRRNAAIVQHQLRMFAYNTGKKRPAPDLPVKYILPGWQIGFIQEALKPEEYVNREFDPAIAEMLEALIEAFLVRYKKDIPIRVDNSIKPPKTESD